MKTFVPESNAVKTPAAQNVITSSDPAAAASSATIASELPQEGKSLSHRPPLQRRHGSPSSSQNAQSDAVASTISSNAPASSTADDSTTEESDSSSVATTTDEEGDDDQPTPQGREGGKLESEKTRTPEEIEIERLRRALHAKMLLNQQRARVMNKPSPELNAILGVGARRVSPIREEGASTGSLSPTLNAAFASPLPRGAQTASTESTESAKTIRGSVPPTPLTNQIRTPSYPFPYVPGTPRAWGSASHQPFTMMSPTTAAGPGRQMFSPLDQFASGGSTPASVGTFVPPGSQHTLEDEQYPAPNLYDTVLLLNSEPGLDAWWSTVASIVHRWFGAERATLAVPADASDLENVPWGQKCTFNIAGPSPLQPEPNKPHHTNEKKHTPEKGKGTEFNSASGHNTRRRPNLEARHSFAGHERPAKDVESASSKLTTAFERPRPPLRTVSHAPHTLPRGEHPLRHVSPVGNDGTLYSMPHLDSTFSDPDFSSVGDHHESPHMLVFPVLRALTSEKDPLIDSAGINRILERGKLVTLTRDYTATSQAEEPKSAHQEYHSASSGSPPSHRHSGKPRSGPFANRITDDHGFGLSKLTTHYEEYEQFPTSPWSQSPAPSPAIQSDPSENPFFSALNVDEESFNPAGSIEDYSKMDAVEAIGVDVASTVTHIPLIHPVLSQPMQSIESDAQSDRESNKSGLSRDRSSRISFQSERPSFERKAPIAILSILSSAVPFPQSWTNSLRLLGPHLATSFSNALQFTTAQKQASTVRQGRYQLGHHAGFGPYSTDTERSMTSPSDYSSRSRHSPGGSVGGTPGWDSASFGFATSKHSVGSTPAHLVGAEMIDSYFDAKKKSNKSSGSSSASLLQSQAQGRSSPTIENRPMRKVASPMLLNEPDTPTPIVESKPVVKFTSREEQGNTGVRDTSPSRSGQLPSPRRPTFRHQPASEAGRRPHSLLHSYGADFASSFQGLPAATTPLAHTPGPGFAHARSNSMSEVTDMPPPSERLLRTIIDSLPVQIFTAAPGTGALTWVNSKFLVYRGKDSRQVLQEPWQAIHPDDRNEYMTMWQKSLRTGQQLQQKVRLLRFDGNYRWFYVRAAPLKDKRQNIVHWIGTNMDFHDQHLAEMNSARQQETAASEAKYRALANSSPQIVFAVTQSKGVIFCNSQWTSYSGQSGSEACGLGFMDHVHPDDIAKCRLPNFDAESGTATNVPTTVPQESKTDSKDNSISPISENSSDTEKLVTSPGDDITSPATQAKLSKLASTGILKVTKDADGRPSYSTEVRLRSKDGNYRWHLVRILLSETISKDPNEEDTWYGTCTDINDHKLLEQTLKETMDAKSRFLSNMSHEIRTPLNGITGMVNFLIDSNLTSEQLEHVNIIRHSTEGLRNLIDDILDLSKVEAGMITLSLSWFHVRSLIEEVNDLMSAMAINKGLELNHVVGDDVPSMLKGDRFRIRQILLNVVGNAIKFTSQGEVFVRCAVAEQKDATNCKENELMLQFEVIDSGTGFTEKDAEFLFKRFSQIDGSTTRQQGGTGLGLAISMQLAELHGGKMKASSVPGKGSTFTFTINFQLPQVDNTGSTDTASTMPTLPVSQKTASLIASAQQEEEAVRKGFTIYGSPGHDQIVKSPSSLLAGSHASPALSSGSSIPSTHTAQTSTHSTRSSASSYVQELNIGKQLSMNLSFPSSEGKTSRNASVDSEHTFATGTTKSTIGIASAGLPPLFSILVVCPLEYSRLATVKHIESTLPKSIPHQITARSNIQECRDMLGGDNPVKFTHIILVLHEVEENIAFMHQVLRSGTHPSTSLMVITDLAQKREIIKQTPEYKHDKLLQERRLVFIFKPLKASKFAVFFDPQKEREISNDRNQDSAQAVAVSQKAVFDDLKKRLGNKGHRVLLVEDNQINQTVLLKFLRKVSIDVDTVVDGVQCTDQVFSKPHGFYSIILCDLHMPNKDGYQTCKEIRQWERSRHYPHLPIIALSANVLGDVYAKCVEAGFNSYVTKPVDFKVLSDVIAKFLDPEVVRGRPHEFMKPGPTET